MLEVLGRQCKRYRSKRNPKSAVEVSLFTPEEKQVNPRETSFVKNVIKAPLFSSNLTPTGKNNIILSSDLPSVPFYMPKLASRTPSPLRATRSKFINLRLNLYTPFQSIQDSSHTIRQERKQSRPINQSLTLKAQNLQKNTDRKKSITKFNIKDLDFPLPSIIINKKLIKKA
jgi:hypothetical protein